LLVNVRLRLAREDGSVIALVALLTPALVLLLALAVQIGNWYTHKRHLQVQVDAAALAAGQMFTECLNTAGGTVQTDMEGVANQYGGISGSPLYNTQVGSASGHAGAVTLVYQRNAYPAPNNTPPDTDVPEGQDACTSGMFDVKATEAGIPHLFNIGLLPVNVHAHARVQLRALTEQKGLMPVAVPDTRFNFVFATFIDENTGLPPSGCPGTCTEELQKSGTVGGEQQWTSPNPISVPITSANIGVRLRLVGGPNPASACDVLYTECYDALSNNGIVHVRGWSAGSGVWARNVWLLPGSCAPDSYFAKADCSAGLQAEVDLGNHPASGAGITSHVWATVDGGGKYQLASGGGSSGVITWTVLSGIPIAGPGGHTVGLGWDWEQTSGTWSGNLCTSANSNPCKATGTLPAVQRAYEASPDGSGPVHLVSVFQPGGVSSGANSFQRGTTQSLGVTISTTGTLLTQSQATGPVIYLRVVGSQNQSVDCDPDIPNLRGEIAAGCGPSYAINPTFNCPDYNVLWTTPQPWQCAKTQTGGAVGQVPQGLRDRVLGGSNSCTAPINWPNFDVDDPRILPLIVTPFGSFTGTGNAVVPVIDFAAFYVVGWQGDPCPGAVSVPKGYIVGHFIKFIPRNPKGSGDAACFLTDPTQLTPCAAVLTR
jgi:hypothetical protein